MLAQLAIGWEPELRGVLIVIIAVAVLMGSVYLILGTNLGARLGFLVALTGLAGWMFVMGAIWWTYGKGLLGPDASWQPVRAQNVLRNASSLSGAGVLDAPVVVPADTSPTEEAALIDEHLTAEGWKKLDASLPAYQQAQTAAAVMLEESGALGPGQYTAINVFDIGGQRSPQLFDGKVDFLAFFHKPHYSVVEFAPLVPQRSEPGRAPARPVINTTQPHQYVYMIRDLGAKRQPAGFLTIGSLIVFLVLCYLLHSRDRTVLANTSAKALPARA